MLTTLILFVLSTLRYKKEKVTTSDIFNHTHTAYPFGNEGESALIVYEAFRVERFSRK